MTAPTPQASVTVAFTPLPLVADGVTGLVGNVGEVYCPADTIARDVIEPLPPMPATLSTTGLA